MKISNHLVYKKLYEKYGISHKALHWSTKNSQEKRFEVLISFIKNNLKESSILDAGCGYAHLLDYLNKQDVQFKSYLGIDCEEFMIDICQKKYNQNSFKVLDILTDKLPKYDYIVCSGALNLLSKEDIYKFIKNCLDSCNKAFIFNFILNNLYNVSKEDILNYCKNYDYEVKYTQGYLKNDLCVFIGKDFKQF